MRTFYFSSLWKGVIFKTRRIWINEIAQGGPDYQIDKDFFQLIKEAMAPLFLRTIPELYNVVS